MKDYLRIDGKVAIVTGSGRGIGRGIALALASYGVKVMVTDINDENGNNVKKEIMWQNTAIAMCAGLRTLKI